MNDYDIEEVIRRVFPPYTPEPEWVREVAWPRQPQLSLHDTLKWARHIAQCHPYDIGRETCVVCQRWARST